MRYRLAIKEVNGKYKELLIGKIDAALDTNNNLQKLCQFTMNFENQRQLKEELMAQKILPVKYLYDNLYILYHYNGKEIELRIPYHNDQIYYDINFLTNTLYQKFSLSNNFFNVFIKYFSTHKFLDEYALLINAYNSFYNLKSAIYSFINAYIHPKNKLSFFNFHNMAMFLSIVDEIDKRTKNKQLLNSFDKDNNIESFNEDQLKLF